MDLNWKPILQAYLKVSDDRNYTVSTLKYAPSVRENEKSLRCRAENPVLAGSIIENIITLEVSCKSHCFTLESHFVMV